MRLVNVALLVAMLMVAPFAYGQTDQGVITGTITDSTGAVIPGANLTIREINTNVTAQVQSNASGTYVAGPFKIALGERLLGLKVKSFDTLDGATIFRG